MKNHFHLANRFLYFWTFLCAVLSVSPIKADTANPLEPVDTSSPRTTLAGFLESGREAYDLIVAQKGARSDIRAAVRPAARRMLSCLDLSEEPAYLRQSRAAEAAVCLLEIFDRIELPLEEDIPGLEEVEATPEEEALEKWRIPNTSIVIHRVEQGPREGD